MIFFWPELKTQAKSLFEFFYFQISLFDFFCGLCPLDFVFLVCFWFKKTKFGGQKLIIIGLCPPQFVFYWSKAQKKQNPGDTSHKKNQISLFENKKKSNKLFACVLSSGQKKSQSTSINCKNNKADIGSFLKFASKLVSIIFFNCLHVLVTFFGIFLFLLFNLV